MSDEDQAEQVRQQALADLEKERQEAIDRAKAAEDEEERERARKDAEAAAALAAMEIKSREQRNK
jgi:hypothetical protein